MRSCGDGIRIGGSEPNVGLRTGSSIGSTLFLRVAGCARPNSSASWRDFDGSPERVGPKE
jgi:hypothetical protein